MRLNRYLAACGLGSRRSCESIIEAGRVTVNGRQCKKLATTVGEGDVVAVDAEVVTVKRTATLILHKPPGYLCTKNDPQNRPTIYDLLPDHLQDLSYVGRLDRDSEGLLVMTNDGELAQSLTHPRYKVEKLYLVTIDRTFNMAEDAKTLLKGIDIDEGFARAVSIHALSPRRLFVVLNQGFKRQLRQMFDSLNYGVKSLVRLRIGTVELGELAPGRWRFLGPEEIKRLSVNPADGKKKTRSSASSRPRSGPRGTA
ncbi:MAG: rRNA pseudouridine synthase [Verrucomicrobiae bacterium]|nr:rRNA pseudouridine synthase [Verrucomicrobiae bacterium]